jgi:hypothetical protein
LLIANRDARSALPLLDASADAENGRAGKMVARGKWSRGENGRAGKMVARGKWSRGID